MKPLPYDKVKQLIPGNTIPATRSKSSEFTLETIADGWRIGGVLLYPGEYVTVDFADKLLEKGEMKRHDQWVAYTKSAQESGGFGVTSAPFYHSIFSTLYAHRNDVEYKDNIKQIQTFLQKVLRPRTLVTLSSVIYNPQGKDFIKHSAGIFSVNYGIKETICGQDGYIKSIESSANVCNALLVDNNPGMIHAVYQWITERDTYLARLEQKPELQEKRVISFGMDPDNNFTLYAIGDLQVARPALGVRAVRSIRQESGSQ